MKMTGFAHPYEEDLAALAEGRMAPAAAAPLERHLAECRSCMAAYTDAVRYRAGWLASPESFEPTPELVERGAGMVRARRFPRAAVAEPGPGWRRLAIAGATLTVALGLLFVARSDLPARLGGPPLPQPIRLALEDLSGRGLVLPGGEAGAASTGPVLRSGQGPTDPALDAAVKEAKARYESGRWTRASVYPVAAGLHASGQMEAARDYVEQGLRSDPNDVRLLILRADIAYRASDMVRAEHCLRRALALRRDSPAAALDLGLVLADGNQREEAARWFEQAADQGPPSIATRARRELAALKP
jgi:tetratricopeptide (TPR) repeat protein